MNLAGEEATTKLRAQGRDLALRVRFADIALCPLEITKVTIQTSPRARSLC